jgi:hypothetical protein
MKTMQAVERYHRLILARTDNRESISVSSIPVKQGEQESFKHALADLVISGMVMYTKLNPDMWIKRIA